MNRIIRIVIALVLLAVAAFCAFGFLATFEPPSHIPLRVAYGCIGLACLAGASWLMMMKPR